MPIKPKKKEDDWMPKCASCVFFLADAKESFGECRRYPPATFPDDEGIGFSFAITEESQWCGEFQRVTN